MRVTCYADASFSHDVGGTWAVWLRSDEGRIVQHGTCPPYVKGSADAELAAIYAGMFLAVRAWGPLVGTILVCSDCQAALELIAPEHRLSRSPATRRLQERIGDLLRSGAIKLETKWVKAHQSPEKSTESFLNDHCDRLAQRTRRAIARADRRRGGPAAAAAKKKKRNRGKKRGDRGRR